MKLASKNKIILSFIVGLLFSGTLFAQILKAPRVSQHAKVFQTVGLAEIEIDYHRPSVNGREIWGKLVPYGMSPGVQFGSGNPFPWRAGANENTTITFSNDVKIEGKKLMAGTYGLSMIPEKNEWTIIFSNNHTSWGSFFYDPGEDALRVKVKPESAPHQEQLIYAFENVKKNSATVYLRWEKLKIPINLEFDADKIVFESFKNELRSAPGFNWQSWNQAAFYCLQNNTNLEQGLKWVNRSIDMQSNANNTNLKGYFLMTMNKMDEALKIFRENVEKYPGNWNVFDSLGEALAKNGSNGEAIEYYEKALDKAPQNQKERIQGVIKDLKNKS